MPLAIHVLRKFEPNAWGGIETHLVGLLPELARLGWESEVHAPAEAGTDGEPLRRIGATFRTFRARYPYLGLAPDDRARLVASGGNLVSPEELFALVSDRRAAVFHTHTQGRLGGVVRTAARLRGVPYATTLHGPVRAGAATIERDISARTKRLVDLGAPFGLLVGARRVVHDADLLYTLNRDEHAAWTADRAGRHHALVSHGVSLQRATLADRAAARASVPGLGDAPFVVIVGRKERTKGQDLGIAAFLRGAPSDVHLVVAGAEMDADFAAELARMAAGDARVHLVPSVGPRVARALLAEATIALIPSRAEPFGLVLLEAWAEGTPAVFAAVGGLVDIARRVDAIAGLVEDPTDVTLGARLGAALASASFRNREADAGPVRVAAHFSWRALAEVVAADYERAAPSVQCRTFMMGRAA
jgi:glycosyltransferase involved in cell wall biosynthesis